MKLYEISRGSRIKTRLNSGKEVFITFHHLDGAYSYCTLEDGDPDNVVHLSASTPLKEWQDDEGNYYTIEE